MCGIVAVYSPGAPLPPLAARPGVKALAHRGPDGSGLWQSDDGRVALGHTRLSLIDPLAHQPLASEEDRLRLVANGEFYGYRAIRSDLLQRGHQLRTRSDSEIALHLYEDRGTACLHALRGEFAFVLWDEARQTLFAARDRFGIKPLFYAHVGPTLYLASEIKALLALGVDAKWDTESVFQAMHLCFDPARSLFAGIRQVPPAHMLLATPDGVRLERYWDIPYPPRRAVKRHSSDAASANAVRALLSDAVQLRLDADVPVGCLLSGGVDSSTVLGLAARHSQRRLAAFTIGFNHTDYDETAAARAAAEHAGAELHVLTVTDRDLADHFADAVVQGEMFQLNAHGTARFLLSRAIQQAGYKCVMAGEGADELFAGYAFLSAALPQGGRQTRWPAWLTVPLSLLQAPTVPQKELAETSPWLARLSQVFPSAAPAVDSLLERLRLLRSVLAPDFVAMMNRQDPYRRLLDGLDRRAALPSWEPAKAMLYVWLRTIFASYHMAADRLDMAHAVEVRLPFLDHVLFEHVSQIPVGQLAMGGQNKSLLRDVARPFVSDSVYRRSKQPFLAPPAAATPGNPLHDFVHETLRGSTLPFADRAAVGGLLDGLPQRGSATLPAVEALLMMLASLTILHERYFS